MALGPVPKDVANGSIVNQITLILSMDESSIPPFGNNPSHGYHITQKHVHTRFVDKVTPFFFYLYGNNG